MNAVMPSSWPAAIACQSSQLTLIVVSAAAVLFGDLAGGAVEQDHALIAEVELDALAGHPGLPFLHPRNQFLLGHRCFLPCQLRLAAR